MAKFDLLGVLRLDGSLKKFWVLLHYERYRGAYIQHSINVYTEYRTVFLGPLKKNSILVSF